MLQSERVIRPYSPLEDLTSRIIRCAIEVHRVLGPGLLESVYAECLSAEMRNASLSFQQKVRVPIIYKDVPVSGYLEVDFLVERAVILEIKAVDKLAPVHQAQVITYLKMTGCQSGLLMNFNSVLLRDGLRRVDHPELYRRRKNSET